MTDIEQNFKNSLENYELPYNASAWDSLSSKLDSEMPVSEATTPAASNYKWFIASSSVVVLSIAAYFLFFNNNTESKRKDNSIIQNETILEPTSNNPSKVNNDSKSEKITENSSSTSETVQAEANTVDNEMNLVPVLDEHRIAEVNSVSNERPNSNRNNSITKYEGNNNPIRSDAGSISETNSNSSAPVTIPIVQDVCEGDFFEIDNTNNVPLEILGSELQITVPPNTVKTISLSNEGVYSLRAQNGNESVNVQNFHVKKAPNVDFTIDLENIFDKGLPTTNVNTDVIGELFNWSFNKQKATGRNVAAHFYTKGEHEIELSVTANNGCTASTVKSIYVDKKYNLMAENAFIPTDNDPRNNRFMPYALTVRDVKFTLIVLDPSDGHMVFKTNDSSNGWDGTDMKTGSPVAYEKSHIWKVVILNPEPNEPNEYGGNIIPIRQK